MPPFKKNAKKIGRFRIQDWLLTCDEQNKCFVISRDNLYMRYDENADTLEFDWFQNEPSHLNLEDSSQWHSVNEARRVFGRKPVDKFLTRYLSCGIDTVKVQVNFPNMQTKIMSIIFTDPNNFRSIWFTK